MHDHIEFEDIVMVLISFVFVIGIFFIYFGTLVAGILFIKSGEIIVGSFILITWLISLVAIIKEIKE